MTTDQRAANLSDVVRRHEPWDLYQHTDESHPWALVTATGESDGNGLKWLRTFADRTAVDDHVRHKLTTGEHLVALVDLANGQELLPVLQWLPNECTWPTCSKPPAADGRGFLGGAMCRDHTDESYERDAAARDEITAARDADGS